MFKAKMVKKLDERQQLFLLKSYQLGFWVVMGLSWLGVIFGKQIRQVLPTNEGYAMIFWLGIATQSTYVILKGIHPLVAHHPRKLVFPLAVLVFCFALGVLIIASLESVWSVFEKGVFNLSFMVLFASLMVMSASCIYTLLKQGREEGE